MGAQAAVWGAKLQDPRSDSTIDTLRKVFLSCADMSVSSLDELVELP